MGAVSLGVVTGVRAESASDSRAVLHNEKQQSLYLGDSSNPSLSLLSFFFFLSLTIDLFFMFSVAFFFSSIIITLFLNLEELTEHASSFPRNDFHQIHTASYLEASQYSQSAISGNRKIHSTINSSLHPKKCLVEI